MKEPTTLEMRAADLRSAFDKSFALPPVQVSVERDDLLTIRVAGAPYAIRLHEVTGIVTRRKVISVPNAGAHLLGVSGIRGNIVPVFSLASILGYGPATDSPRWLILCGVEEPLGLGFSDFDGYLQVPTSSFHSEDLTSSSHGYVKEVVRTEVAVFPVISLPLVSAALQNQTSPSGLTKEQ